MNIHNNTEGHAIGKRTLISIEFVVAIGVMLIAVTSSWIRSENGLNKNTEDIAELAMKVESNYEQTTGELIKINDTLTKMLTAQEVQNGINIYKLRDRWTAGMMSEHDNRWLKLLQEFHPKLRHDDVPSVGAIQSEFGFTENQGSE